MEQYDCLAEWYDLFFDASADLGFYLAEAQRELDPSDPVLEVGCGTGRVLRHLTARGFPCVGVDISSAMLGRAAEKLRVENPEASSRVRLERGDMRSLALRERFKMAIAAWSSFFELAGPEERRLALASLYDHLLPNGTLILDCSVYDIRGVGWGRKIPQARQTAAKEYVKEGCDVKCSETRTFDRATHRLDITVTLDGWCDGKLVHQECPCILYYATPETIRAEITAAGFSSVETFGYYDRAKLYDPRHAADGRQIHVARKA